MKVSIDNFSSQNFVNKNLKNVGILTFLVSSLSLSLEPIGFKKIQA
jgi:hypothetical protein